MGFEPAAPDWPPLTAGEAATVLARYRLTGGEIAPAAAITWRSPRPMSAAALVRGAGHEVFIKRHDRRVRTSGQLAAEHAFAGHLRRQGLTVPAVLRTALGGTVVALGDAVYEVHEAAPGTDLYRDKVSWSPFLRLGHAYAAGAALARLHAAAANFAAPPRPAGVLVNSCDVVTAADPLARVGEQLAARPGLAGYLARRPWAEDMARHLLPGIRRAAPLLAALPPRWGHGDWHPSNLTWAASGGGTEVVAVFDFGLANRTFVAHDLAIALERSMVAWLDLAETGKAGADLDAVGALLDGYETVRPLRRAETLAIAEVLPVVHTEYALSEVEYFASVTGKTDLADLAYDAYLLGHAEWFSGTEGAALLDHLRRRAHARPSGGGSSRGAGPVRRRGT